MPEELEKFIDFSQENTIENFMVDTSTPLINNEPSNFNMSAYSAALVTPEQSIKTYLNIGSELSISGRSTTMDSVIDTVRSRSEDQTRHQLSLVLSDPNVSELRKQDFVNSFINRVVPSDVRFMAAQEALRQDSEPTATEEHEIIRLNTIDQIREINDYNKQVQSVINRELAKTDPSTISKVVDFAEIIVPFTEGAQAGTILNDLREATGQDEQISALAKGLALLGSTKAEIRDTMRRVPPEQRIALTESLLSIVNEHSGIVFSDSNDITRMEILRAGLEAGYYSEADEWIDNITSILDLSIIGAPIARGVRGLNSIRAARRAAQAEGRLPEEVLDQEFLGLGPDASVDSIVSTVNRRLAKSRVQATSISQMYKTTNTARARAVHEAVALDDTGEAARALYGTSRQDALANDLLPEMPEIGGTVKQKLPDAGRAWNMVNTPDPKVMDFAKSDGAIYLWKEEKRALEAQVVNDFKNAMGITSRDDMFQHEVTGGGVNVRAMYGQTDGGWADPEVAVNAVKFSLRDYGITEDQIQLMARYEGDFIPVDLQDELAKATIRMNLMETGQPIPREFAPAVEYMVGVNTEYRFNPADIINFEPADVKLNLFDRIPVSPISLRDTVGSLQRHVVDAHSMLHTNLTFGANVSVDRAVGLEKSLVELGREYAQGFQSLSKERKAVINDMIKEANARGIEFSRMDMKAAGLSDTEMDVLRNWRNVWDNIYFLENADLARTLRSQNYRLLVDEANDSRLFVRPLQVSGNVRVYNPTSGSIDNLTAEAVSEIYEKGGSIGRIRQPLSVDDDFVELISVANNEGEYLRAIRDSDQVLNYRKGYYQVHYKDPRFIIKRELDSNGNLLYEKAVATAANIKDADEIIRRLSATDGGEYFQRADRGKSQRTSSDDYWSVQTSAGRTAQRLRGQRLEDATSTITDPSHENILDPVTALTKSIRGLSRRVSMRNYLETTKQRFISQYSEYLPRDRFDQPAYPSSAAQLQGRSGTESKTLADARTTWEYINSLENGYVNSIDAGYKAILNSMADTLGTKGLSRTEGVVRNLSEASGPARALRNGAFKMYLATNPLRQFVVQSHQAVQLFANFTPYMLSGRIAPQMSLIAGRLRGQTLPESFYRYAGVSRDEGEAMVRAFERSGLGAAVDANNLVRSDLIHLADTTIIQKGITAANKPIDVLQKVGFDLGEQINILTAWLAHRDRAIRRGLPLNDETYDMIAAEARNYTYNMNAAGDFPYNQNALSVLFQFMQVPHKAMLQMLSNRGLSLAERSRLAAFNTVMYGLPSGMVGSWIYSILPDNESARDAVMNGFETVVFNEIISNLTGTDTRINFSNLSPVEIHGAYDHLTTVFTDTDLMSIITESPAGQLFFGSNPRVTNAYKSAARYFGLIDDYETPTQLSSVAKSSAQLFSGLSNAFKAKYALEYEKKINSAGGVTDKSVTRPEAIAALFGFETLDETRARTARNDLYAQSEAFNQDVRDWYREMKQHLTREGITNEELEFSTRVTAEAWRVFSDVDDQRARQIIFRLLRRDLEAGDERLMKNIFRSMNWGTTEDLAKVIEEVPLEAEEEHKRQQMRDTLQFIIETRNSDGRS